MSEGVGDGLVCILQAFQEFIQIALPNDVEEEQADFLSP
jgi:hypothetical protein